MIRRLFSALNSKYPLLSCSKNLIWSLRMSSENAVESSKRKPEEDSEDSDVKKIKLSTEETVSKIINKALEDTNKVRKPKKVVLLLCYLGKEFYGMQRNFNVSTVEEELFKALLETNIILKGEFEFPKTMKFQRAARTDKGVSAVRQIVSLKIPLKEISDELPGKINNHLPPEVRVIAVKRVTQSFDAKIACDARTYSYMLPTFAFAAKVEENSEDYRITNERIQEVNAFLKNYLGTRNFYNFTSGRLPGDPSCKRYILSCECGPAFESSGLEFSVIKIKGQSFMLHQIRKMVGLAIAVIRKLADPSVLDKSWLNERIDIPKAPGLGLMLEELHYDWYNTKYGSDGMHEALIWNDYDEVIEIFKKEKICANIAAAEREEKSMLQWLETLPHHSYDVRDAGPPSLLPSKMASAKSEDLQESNHSDKEENTDVNGSTNNVENTSTVENSDIKVSVDSDNNISNVDLKNSCVKPSIAPSESGDELSNSKEIEVKCES